MYRISEIHGHKLPSTEYATIIREFCYLPHWRTVWKIARPKISMQIQHFAVLLTNIKSNRFSKNTLVSYG